MINNGMSWLSLGNYINPKARNTELSNDYNQLTNRPIITLTGTSQNPIKLWKLDVGLYILNGYIQHTDALLSEARGLFVSITVGVVVGKYVISAFIPFWEGQYEYILPSLSSETYIEHQMIRMITQGNSLTLDNIREYFPTQDYHPTTKKYVDETMDAIRNELNKMGLNNNDVQSLIKENRRRDIAIQALLSQNSDKMVTIDEEVHNISMDYSLDEGIATINTLEGSTLVNVSKNTEYDKILSYGQDIVENTNTVDLEADGNVNPIIVGDTLVNVCTQNNPTAITNEYTVEGSNHFALQDEAEGNCRPIIQGNTLVNYCTNGSEELTLNNEINVQGTNVTLTDTVDNGKVDVVCEGNTLVNILNKSLKFGLTSTSYLTCDENGVYNGILEGGNYFTKNIDNTSWAELQPNTTYTLKGFLETTCNTTNGNVVFFTQDTSIVTKILFSNKITENNQRIEFNKTFTTPSDCLGSFGFYVNPVANFDNVKFSFILEYGDTTSYEIPAYFEGMKSVGECEGNKIEILSQTLNLVDDFSKYVRGSNQTTFTKINNHSFSVEGSGSCPWEQINFNIPFIQNAKAGDTFTLFAEEITLLNQDTSSDIGIQMRNSTLNISISNSWQVNANKPIRNGLIKFTIPNNYNGTDMLDLRVHVNHNVALANKVTIKNLMIAKGHVDISSFKPYGLNKKEISLNEPLRGLPNGVCDKFVKQGGKWYVERNCGKIVLDGTISLGITKNDGLSGENNTVFNIPVAGSKYYKKDVINSVNNKLVTVKVRDDVSFEYMYKDGWNENFFINLKNSNLTTLDKSGLLGWLSKNPIELIYELATPTYEEITDPTLITYLDTTHISTNSIIPCNMQVKNSGYNAIIKPSTKYTVVLNANINEEINVDLGGTEVTTTNNVITITTPNTLTNENLMLYGKNVVINNAMLFEGDMTSNLPSEYIEGLKSSFEDRYIENLFSTSNLEATNVGRWQQIIASDRTLKPGVYTLFYDITSDGEFAWKYAKYNETTTDFGAITNLYGKGVQKYTFPEGVQSIYLITLQAGTYTGKAYLFEGDWTHLTEEDLNHLGQYKVEYKVTGKNKANTIDSLKEWDGAKIHFKNAQIDFIPRSNNSLSLEYENPLNYNLKKGATYTLSTKQLSGGAFSSGAMGVGIRINYTDGTDSLINIDNTIWNYNDIKSITFTTKIDKEIREVVLRAIGYDVNNATANVYSYALQLEEGTVVTEYEPYKESIQTVYLNSPLLEGDTIEEIDGEVYHVHRYGKVVLDGSTIIHLQDDFLNQNNTIGFSTNNNVPNGNNTHGIANSYCDNFINMNQTPLYNKDIEGMSQGYNRVYIRINKSKLSTQDADGLKQWLSENPTTVVYELATPTYELIPSSSIVCKSYPNGHLDFDTNVHIDNTVNFVKANLPITYANTSTNYKLQFVSDKDMENVTINAIGNIMENVTINKGLNKISFTSPSDATNILTFEGLGYAYISNVQLVATEKDIDYFKGLYSTYECGLIEDESNENYGKYEVNIVSYNAPIQFGKGGKFE